MNGPYKFNFKNVTDIVSKISSGAYILSRNGNNAHYVGRSDTNIESRLESWLNEYHNYTHFWFEYTNSQLVAFEIECNLWHKYHPIDNKIHPDRPVNSNWLCPVCAFFSNIRG